MNAYFLLHRACTNLDTWKTSDVNFQTFFGLSLLDEDGLYNLALIQK